MSRAYAALRLAFIPVEHTLWRLAVSGASNIPKDGPVILAANHLSAADHMFLPVVSPRPVYFMAKAEYFTARGPVPRARASFMRAVGQVPIDRRGGRAALAGLEQCRQVIESGKVFGIFPEGTRSPDGRLYRGKTGVARLALMTGAPVVPVGLLGTEKVLPIGTVVPRPGHRVVVRFGEPISWPRVELAEQDVRQVRAITDEIMARIGALSGQETVNGYAVGRARAVTP